MANEIVVAYIYRSVILLEWSTKTTEEKIMTKPTNTKFDHLRFTTPRVNQGQIIIISYAADWENGQIVSHAYDSSDGTESYAVTPVANLRGEYDPLNSEPRFHNDGMWTPAD